MTVWLTNWNGSFLVDMTLQLELWIFFSHRNITFQMRYCCFLSPVIFLSELLHFSDKLNLHWHYPTNFHIFGPLELQFFMTHHQYNICKKWYLSILSQLLLQKRRIMTYYWLFPVPYGFVLRKKLFVCWKQSLLQKNAFIWALIDCIYQFHVMSSATILSLAYFFSLTSPGSWNDSKINSP